MAETTCPRCFKQIKYDIVKPLVCPHCGNNEAICPQCGISHTNVTGVYACCAHEEFDVHSICPKCKAGLFFNRNEVGYCHYCGVYTSSPIKINVICPHCDSEQIVCNTYRERCPNCTKWIDHPMNLTTDDKMKKPFVKNDQEKLLLQLIPPSLIRAVGAILTYGAKKYSPHNWEKGADWDRLFGAILRHLYAFWEGENLDPESGLPHLWHAACNITFMIEHYECDLGTDNRAQRDRKDFTTIIQEAIERAKNATS